jgi:hypothetical protein
MTRPATADPGRSATGTTGAARHHALYVPNRLFTTSTMTTRSTEMYTMHEALARERLRPSQREAEQLRVARELAAARRWHRVELRASAAGRRARSARRRHAVRAI